MCRAAIDSRAPNVSITRSLPPASHDAVESRASRATPRSSTNSDPHGSLVRRGSPVPSAPPLAK